MFQKNENLTHLYKLHFQEVKEDAKQKLSGRPGINQLLASEKIFLKGSPELDLLFRTGNLALGWEISNIFLNQTTNTGALTSKDTDCANSNNESII